MSAPEASCQDPRSGLEWCPGLLWPHTPACHAYGPSLHRTEYTCQLHTEQCLGQLMVSQEQDLNNTGVRSQHEALCTPGVTVRSLWRLRS